MTNLTAENIYSGIKKRVAHYNPFAVTWLGADDVWHTNPCTIAERISNEVWHTLWEFHQKPNFISHVKSLFNVFKQFDITPENINKLGECACEERCDSPFLLFFELLYNLIEYRVHDALSTAYVAQWDSKGKIRKAFHVQEKDQIISKARNCRIHGLYEKACDALNALCIKIPNPIVEITCAVVIEEEKFRYHLDLLLGRIETTHHNEDLYGLLSEQFSTALGTISKEPKALLRPCVEILSHAHIPFNSGLQFEAASILGRLNDYRCAEVVTDLFNNIDARNSSVRNNLIYIIGNLRYLPALPLLQSVLKSPDSVKVSVSNEAHTYTQPTFDEKCEAIWALGKYGAEGISSIPLLRPLVGRQYSEMRWLLAYSFGTIGSAQKARHGGVDADIVTSLLQLLTSKDKKVFEETVYALKRLGLPDFLHTLYLHSYATLPVLSLKPSRTGFYELSETLLDLLEKKQTVVMAVTGDSGTGKTYFCQSIANGIGDVPAHQILHLMRDKPTNTVFNRILGLKWLKDHIDSQYYQDYDVSEEKDDPEEFFDSFLQSNANKRLIMLDGWGDEVYFYQVLRKFYERGLLDIIVNFQTSCSTRRINLEEREGILESVKKHLPLVEEISIQEMPFYRDGEALLYELDNSIPSRLTQDEIQAIFQKQKVQFWGEHIRLGKFAAGTNSCVFAPQPLTVRREKFESKQNNFSASEQPTLELQEEHFTRRINENLARSPNLLYTVDTHGVTPSAIAWYRQGQIAFGDTNGLTGILTSYNARMYYCCAHKGKVTDICLLRGNIYSIGQDASICCTSFRNTTLSQIAQCSTMPTTIAAFDEGTIITGHENGTIHVWKLYDDFEIVLKGHTGAITSLAALSGKQIISGSADGELRIWNMAEEEVDIFDNVGDTISSVDITTNKDIYAAVNNADDKASILIVPRDVKKAERISIDGINQINTIHAYFDGRVLMGTNQVAENGAAGNLVVLDTRSQQDSVALLPGHTHGTHDCLTMGPRIITCGIDEDHECNVKVWGTRSYVKMEHEKLVLLPEDEHIPDYYRSLF